MRRAIGHALNAAGDGLAAFVDVRPTVRPEDEAAALRAKEAADHKAWLRANAESVIVPEHPAVALLRERVAVAGCFECGSPDDVHDDDCRLAAILAGKPGDRVLAELLAEERERGREEVEVAASRKAAEQYRAMCDAAAERTRCLDVCTNAPRLHDGAAMRQAIRAAIAKGGS